MSLPHQGGDTVQGESLTLRRKPDPNRPWGIKPEMGLVPCQVANSNPALGNPTVPRVGFLILLSKLPRPALTDNYFSACLVFSASKSKRGSEITVATAFRV